MSSNPGEVAGPLDRLPHRPPFRFVSRVDELAPARAGRGVWEVTGREEFFRGHFPGEPVIPGVLLAEALAQLAGLVGGGEAEGAGSAVRLAQVDVKFPAPAHPPASIALAANFVRTLGPLRLYDVEARWAGVVVAAGRVTLAATQRAGDR
jgi:3-hydroxyacyl-[acyl-carrier-protein] dehydratase